MIAAVFWSALATVTLLIGMWLAYRNLVGLKWTGLIGIWRRRHHQRCSLSACRWAILEDKSKPYLVGLGLALGALVFYFADRWVDNMGGEERMDFDGAQSGGSGTGILLGSMLDGVPESLVLGLSLVHSPQVSLAFIFAVAISNIPQGLGGTAGMLAGGGSKSKITRLWLAVCGLSILASVLGYWLGGLFPAANGAMVDAFAAGALLVMLTDSMIPESFEHGGKETGLSLVLGFSIAVAVSLMQLS